MRIILLVFILTLSACGNPKVPGNASINGYTTIAHPMKLKDGSNVWLIECPGLANNWGNCWARANHLCPNGFTLINQNGHQGSAAAIVTPQGGFAGQRTERVATISCN